MKPLVEAKNLKAYYVLQSPYGEEEYVYAVDNVNLFINEDENFGIAGESGCGKSTLLKILYGLIDPPLRVFDGEVVFNLDNQSFDLLSLNSEELNSLRWKTISYIPQGSMNVLNPTMRIRKHFMQVIKIHQRNITETEAEKLIKEHMEELGLPVDVLRSYPHQLSGGMRQRVVIALSTILRPRIIFADEPTTALDVVVQRGVIQMLRDIKKRLRNSLVLVTHDMGVQAEITDRIAIMYAGKIVEIGPAEDVFEKPYHPYTRFLIDSLPMIGDKTKKQGMRGLPPSLREPPIGCRFFPRCPQRNDLCGKEDPPMIKIAPERFVACHEYAVR